MSNAANHTWRQVLERREQSIEKALKALAGYKFEMFGYWAAAWVKYNQLLPREHRDPNPFRRLVKKSRQMKVEYLNTVEGRIGTNIDTEA